MGANLSPFNPFLTPTADRDRTVSRRSEPSSRTALNGEQPYPWDLLQPQDAMSRHRGAPTSPSMWALGGDQPVIPGVPFILWAMALPLRTTGSLWPTFVSARLVCLAVKLVYAIILLLWISNPYELTFVSLRYFLGGDRPSQTTHQTLSSEWITLAS